MIGTEESYECDRIDLFVKLDDPEYFAKFIRHQYRISFSGARLRPTVSDYNLQEALNSYKKDTNELRDKENQGKPIEKFKKAAFIAYWLRRVSPITAVIGSVNLTRETRLPTENLLLNYANEFCAFDLGYRICRAVEAGRIETQGQYVRTEILTEGTRKPGKEYLLHLETSYTLEKNFVENVCHLLKEKNVSPHALYLIYKALFLRLQA